MAGKVMIVDDEADMVDAARMVLEMDGYEVVPAYCGEEALQKVENELPDLILLDQAMPDKTGVEVCRILKANSKTKNIPVLMFTASGTDFESIVVEAGADGYFRKPFAPEELLAEVEKYLGQARARKPSNQ